MYCGLRYESIADMPPKMREQIQGKLMDQIRQKKAVAVAAGPEAPAATGSKYHNEKAEVDGIKFDSRKEARRFCRLKLAMELGVIEDLRLQVDFTLIEAYTDTKGERHQAAI